MTSPVISSVVRRESSPQGGDSPRGVSLMTPSCSSGHLTSPACGRAEEATTPWASAVSELLHRRDVWRANNVGESSSFVSRHAVGDEGRGRKVTDIVEGRSSSSGKSGKVLQSSNWPSIGETFLVGKGAQRRLTMVPQKFSDWCVDASSYHPTTREGQKRLHLQVQDGIKQCMFLGQN